MKQYRLTILLLLCAANTPAAAPNPSLTGPTSKQSDVMTKPLSDLNLKKNDPADPAGRARAAL